MSLKRCDNCHRLKILDEVNFVPRPKNKSGWRSACRVCYDAVTSRHRAPTLPESVAVVIVEKPPTPTQLKRAAEERASQLKREREREIVGLIRCYEAVRDVPGPDRTAAYELLAAALRQHGRHVSDDVREWEWSRGLAAIQSRLIARKWKPPEDRHADPCRVAWDSLNGSRSDLVEIQ